MTRTESGASITSDKFRMKQKQFVIFWYVRACVRDIAHRARVGSLVYVLVPCDIVANCIVSYINVRIRMRSHAYTHIRVTCMLLVHCPQLPRI